MKPILYIVISILLHLQTTLVSGAEALAARNSLQPSQWRLQSQNRNDLAKSFPDSHYYKNAKVPRGYYDIGGASSKIIIAGDPEKKDPPRVTLTVADRCEIVNGTINVGRRCRLEGQRVTFENVTFIVDWDAKMKFGASSFINCRFVKTGGVHAGANSFWSTRFHFDSCLFTKRFIEKWSTKSVGVELKNCTFVDLSLPAMDYRNDAWAEAAHQKHRAIENCHFVNCQVFDSVVWATDNCSYENCAFVKDPQSYPQKKNETIRVRLFVSNVSVAASQLKPIEGKVAYRWLDRAPFSVGSKLEPPKATPIAPNFRVWTNHDGRTLTAALLDADGNRLTAQKRHAVRNVTLKLNELSDQDQEYVWRWKAERGLPVAIIQEGTIHLGDNEKPKFEVAEPHGKVWKKSFQLPKWAPRDGDYQLRFTVSGIIPKAVITSKEENKAWASGVFMNSKGLKYLNYRFDHPLQDLVPRTVLLPVNGTMLKVGENTLKIRVGEKEGNADDFQIHRVELLSPLSERESTPALSLASTTK